MKQNVLNTVSKWHAWLTTVDSDSESDNSRSSRSTTRHEADAKEGARGQRVNDTPATHLPPPGQSAPNLRRTQAEPARRDATPSPPYSPSLFRSSGVKLRMKVLNHSQLDVAVVELEDGQYEGAVVDEKARSRNTGVNIMLNCLSYIRGTGLAAWSIATATFTRASGSMASERALARYYVR